MRTVPKLSVGLSKEQTGEQRPEGKMSVPRDFGDTVAGRGTLSANFLGKKASVSGAEGMKRGDGVGSEGRQAGTDR